MAQVRKLVGSALAALLLVVFCVSARCEVLCALPAVARCACVSTAMSPGKAMADMAESKHPASSASLASGVAIARDMPSVLSCGACEHRATTPDAEAAAPVLVRADMQHTESAELGVHAVPVDQALAFYAATPPPLLRMTPLVQTSSLRI